MKPKSDLIHPNFHFFFEKISKNPYIFNKNSPFFQFLRPETLKFGISAKIYRTFSLLDLCTMESDLFYVIFKVQILRFFWQFQKIACVGYKDHLPDKREIPNVRIFSKLYTKSERTIIFPFIRQVFCSQ